MLVIGAQMDEENERREKKYRSPKSNCLLKKWLVCYSDYIYIYIYGTGQR